MALPASVAINKIESIRVELEGEVGIEVELQGSSDNSERMGLDHITSLQNALKEIPGVIRVEVDPGDLKNGSYPFVMRVSPDQKLPQAKRGSRRSPGRGGTYAQCNLAEASWFPHPGERGACAFPGHLQLCQQHARRSGETAEQEV